MVQHAGDEVGRSAADRKPVALDELEHLARVPHIAQIDGCALEYRNEEGAQHADEVTDRGAGELAAAVGRVVLQQLACLETQGLMAVHDALGVACGAGGEGDQRRAGGVGGEGAGQRFGVEQIVVRACSSRERSSVPPDQPDDRDVRAEVGLKLHAPELFCRDEDARLGRAEDVSRVPCARRSARSARSPRRGTPTPRTPRRPPSSSAVASATTSPGPTPRARSPAASRRASSSTSRKVPANGRTAECTTKPASGLACSPRAMRSPRVSCVHHPSST